MAVGLGIICSLAWAYGYVTHFTGFIGESRNNKILLLSIAFLICGFFIALVFRILFPRLSGQVSTHFILKVVGGCALGAASILLLYPQAPPFPEQHTLEIIIQDDLQDEPEMVQILSIDRVNYPGGRRIRIDPAELQLSGNWQLLPDYQYLWQGGEPGSIQFQAFMQAGVEIGFKTGSDQGEVKIIWDGSEHVLDLDLLKTGDFTQKLVPAFNLGLADNTRKILLVSAFMARFIILTFLLAVIILLAYTSLKHRVVIRNPGVLAASAEVLLLLFISTLIYIQPVFFEDSNLEAVIRKTLHNPDQPIFKHQLLSIAELDASNEFISNLEGIQYLRNLSELNLRDNQIKDISPISQLIYLKKLNLRSNEITDISPLASLSRLTYLNLHSNDWITSLAPLARFTKFGNPDPGGCTGEA